MPPEPVPLLRHLQGGNPALGELIRRAERIAELNRSLQQWTQEPWVNAVRLVNVRDQVAVFFVDNAAVLVPLRYRSESLLAFLREKLGLDVRRIDIKVRSAAVSRLSRV